MFNKDDSLALFYKTQLWPKLFHLLFNRLSSLIFIGYPWPLLTKEQSMYAFYFNIS